MRSKRNRYPGEGYNGDRRPARYDDSFGSRNYRSSDYYGEGPFGSNYHPGDEYPDEDYYYRRGRDYHNERWYNEGDPYNEDLRDEYDRYGVGLSRGRYYGEPYGSRLQQGSGTGGFFRRAGERLRDTWDHWRGRDQNPAPSSERGERRRQASSYGRRPHHESRGRY